MTEVASLFATYEILRAEGAVMVAATDAAAWRAAIRKAARADGIHVRTHACPCGGCALGDHSTPGSGMLVSAYIPDFPFAKAPKYRTRGVRDAMAVTL